MSTVRWYFLAEEALQPASTFAPFDKEGGTNFPVGRLLFDAATDEAVVFKGKALSYGSGNWTIYFDWYATNATTGTVRWEAALAAITADTDSQDVSTKTFATAQTVDDAHLGTTSKRIQRCSISLSNLDSVAADDVFWLRIRRIGSNGSDTLANDAALVGVGVEYSDS